MTSGFLVPDLRYTQPAKHEIFHDIVLGGMLQSAGMPTFSDSLSKDDVSAIQAFVLDRAQTLYETEAASKAEAAAAGE